MHVDPPDTQGRGMLHDLRGHPVCVLRFADAVQHDARAAFLHSDGLSVNVMSAGFKKPLYGKADLLAGHIVQIAG